MSEFSNNVLDPWLENARTLIFLGAGGVGKTTSSVLASLLAVRLGRKVGLISVDPAKRLAKALGIPLDGSLRSVDVSGLSPKKGRELGSLKACILDQEQVFHEMVKQYSPNESVATKILENSLYKATASNLGGASEYMALAKLHQMQQSKEFDLIIVDTPPDVHAIDFISRPNILANFFEQGVVSWLIKPFSIAQKLGAGKLFSFGEKMMGGLASLTGVQALHRLADFILLMSEVMQGFNQAGASLKQTLTSGDCKVFVVASPRASAFRTSLDLCLAIQNLNMRVDALWINRMPNFPELLKGIEATHFFPEKEKSHMQQAVYNQKSALDQYIRNFKNSMSNQNPSPWLIQNREFEKALETIDSLVQSLESIEALS